MQINGASVRIHFPVLIQKVDDLFNSEVPAHYGQNNEQMVAEKANRESQDQPQKNEPDPGNRARASSNVS